MRYSNSSAFQINFRFPFNYIIIILIFSSITLYSQTKSYIITGHVVDSLSQKPISNIHIISVKNNIGVITDDRGFFEMIIPITPITLEFSFVGYYTKRKRIHITSDTIIIVNLVSKTYELNEVAILSDNNTYNSQINNYTILDYDFIGDSVLVLQKRRSVGGIPSLVLLDRNYDTLLYNIDIPRGSNKIFKDCLNSYHITTKDSAYQIVFNYDSILFYQSLDIHWFYEILNNCLFKKGGDIFFEYPIYQGYGHEIIFINERNKIRNVFIKYVDTESLSSLAENISDISSYYYLHSVVNSSTNDSATISHIHNFNRDSRYVRDFENQPIENSICLVDDTIFYFNYYESKIQSFSSINNLPIEVDIDYQNMDGWGDNILIDQVTDKIYSMIKTKANYQVYLIDTDLGKLDYITKISIFNSENIKINNGFIYYLNRPNSSIYHVKKLSRIKIDNF